MISRKQMLQSSGYWLEEAQNELYRQVTGYMKKEGINQTELAARLGVSKGYISQVLKGEFNYTLNKLIELALAIGKVPQIQFIPIERILEKDVGERRRKNEERRVKLKAKRDLKSEI